MAQQSTGARILVDGTGGLQSGLGFQEASPAALKDAGKVDAIRDYLTRLAKARAWVHTHPDSWASAWAREADIPLSAATLSVKRADQREVPIDPQLIAQEQQTADAFAAAGLIPGKVSIASITDQRFNDTVSG
jgi:sulfonate transport system substrate-binding protein